MKRVLLIGFFLLPTVAGAQLSSENFQIDGFSVGSDASIRASSSNFSVTQETGGLFEVAENESVEVDGSRVIGGYIGDEARVENTENSEGDDGSAVLSERPDAETGGGVVPERGEGTESGSASSSDTVVVEGGTAETAASTTPRSISRFIVETVAQPRQWVWWLLPLLLLLYIRWRLRQ